MNLTPIEYNSDEQSQDMKAFDKLPGVLRNFFAEHHEGWGGMATVLRDSFRYDPQSMLEVYTRKCGSPIILRPHKRY